MKPTPSDWPRMASAVVYHDAAAAIDWLRDAFGFEIRIKVEGENGRIEQQSPEAIRDWKRDLRSPRQAHCAHARSRGARIVEEPAVHDYGEAYWADLSYCALDPQGHYWWITQRLRTASSG